MHHWTRQQFLRYAGSLALTSGLMFGLPQSVGAQSSSRGPTEDAERAAMEALFGPRAAATAFLRYQSGSGDVEFVIDRSQSGTTLLRMGNEEEIWALSSTYGSRGDEFLRNDVGELLLQISDTGSATFYGGGNRMGLAAFAAGTGEPLLLAEEPATQNLQRSVESALGWFDRYAPGRVRIEAAGGLPPVLVYDTLKRVRDAMESLPAGWFGMRQRVVQRIRVEAAARPSIQLKQRFLTIGVTPRRGIAGRPSSAAIRQVLAAAN